MDLGFKAIYIYRQGLGCGLPFLMTGRIFTIHSGTKLLFFSILLGGHRHGIHSIHERRSRFVFVRTRILFSIYIPKRQRDLQIFRSNFDPRNYSAFYPVPYFYTPEEQTREDKIVPTTTAEQEQKNRPRNKPKDKPKNRRKDRPKSRPENKPENRPGNGPEDRPEGRPKNRPKTRRKPNQSAQTFIPFTVLQ